VIIRRSPIVSFYSYNINGEYLINIESEKILELCEWFETEAYRR
jgi:hypothetical protein